MGSETALILAFLVGGALCALAQVLADVSRLSPAHVMVLFVVLGVAAGAVGVYEPLVKLAGAGASIPLTGFGYALAHGVEKEVRAEGVLGALSGSLKATGAGIKAAVVFAAVAALVARPRA